MATVDTPRIDSAKNPRVKALVRLRERRERERSGRALVEGARELLRALESGSRVREAFLCPPLLGEEGRALAATLMQRGVPVIRLSEAAFAKGSIRQGPDGVLGVVEVPDLGATERPALPDSALVLVLAGVEKPGNLGALLRTADAARVDAVVLTGEGTDPWNPGVIRASMGSVFAVPMTIMSADDARAWLARSGLRTVATAPAAERDYWDADLRSGCAILLGPEHAGLGPDWLATADERVRVPMAGLADSLNVAVTGALLAYEARRQRRDVRDARDVGGEAAKA